MILDSWVRPTFDFRHLPSLSSSLNLTISACLFIASAWLKKWVLSLASLLAAIGSISWWSSGNKRCRNVLLSSEDFFSRYVLYNNHQRCLFTSPGNKLIPLFLDLLKSWLECGPPACFYQSYVASSISACWACGLFSRSSCCLSIHHCWWQTMETSYIESWNIFGVDCWIKLISLFLGVDMYVIWFFNAEACAQSGALILIWSKSNILLGKAGRHCGGWSIFWWWTTFQ